MNTFFTGDHHFGHKNICKYAKRPFNSIEEMNETLIRNHNEVVGHDDVVWFMGDFAYTSGGKLKSIIRRLNGKKSLVLGNHDHTIKKKRNTFIGEGLFDGIYDYKEIYVNGQSIILFHYGMRVWNKSHHGSWQLYGHSHGSLPSFGKSVDVGVDSKEISDEYRPYSFDEIKRFMDKQKQEVVDHHK